jgi:hypothetical protein
MAIFFPTKQEKFQWLWVQLSKMIIAKSKFKRRTKNQKALEADLTSKFKRRTKNQKALEADLTSKR